MTTKRECCKGELVFIDTFSGMLKGQYMGLDPENRLIVRVTSQSNLAYKCGEVLSIGLRDSVIPRYCLHWTNSYHSRFLVFPDYEYI